MQLCSTAIFNREALHAAVSLALASVAMGTMAEALEYK